MSVGVNDLHVAVGVCRREVVSHINIQGKLFWSCSIGEYNRISEYYVHVKYKYITSVYSAQNKRKLVVRFNGGSEMIRDYGGVFSVDCFIYRVLIK